MSRRITVLVMAVFGLGGVWPASEAAAQPARRVAVGLALSAHQFADDRVDTAIGIGPLVRLGQRRGWGPLFEFSWYRVEFHTEAAGRAVPLGRLDVRPVMAGPAYTFGGVSRHVSLGLTGGYSFNSFRVDRATRRMFEEQFDTTIDGHAANGFAARASVSTWFELSRDVGLNVFVGYMRTRPERTIISDGRRDTDRLDASGPIVGLGFSYWVF